MKFTDKVNEDMVQNGQKCPIEKRPQKDIVILIILIIGILIRILGITEMPNALNCDEASAGYEAFSILNYGIDRNRKQIASIFSSMGKRTKCITIILDDTIYKNIRTECIISKTPYGNIRLYIFNNYVLIIKEDI